MANDRPTPREDKLDETLKESFPASDAPANTVETGIGVDGQDAPQDDGVDANETATPNA